MLLSRNPNGKPFRQQWRDVRNIVQGLVLGIEKDQAVGQELNLAGAALFDWGELVPYQAERYQMDNVEARLPVANYFELDLSKIQTLLGYQP